jgi:transcription elongation factor Elf1
MSNCPICGSDNISGGPWECDGDTNWQTVTCYKCQYEWLEVYKYWRMEDVNAQAIDENGEVLGNIEDLWDEDNQFVRSWWQSDVVHGNTNLGYWEWVANRKEMEF